MGVSLLDVMGVVTTASALYMSASPATAMFKIHRNRDVGTASILPLATLWVCNHIWTLYGYVTGNMFPVLTTYAIGNALSIIFLAVYIRWTTERLKVLKTCAVALLCNAAVTVYVVLGMNGGFHQSQHTMALAVGVTAIISSLVLYASPLAAIKVVLQTRSSVSLPFTMILAGAVNNVLWAVYGFLVFDMFLIAPSSINAALGLFQVALYVMYHPSRSATAANVLTPKDELSQISFAMMSSNTPLPTISFKESLEACSIIIHNPSSISIEEPRVPDSKR